MSKTPADFKELFSQLNSKLESTDPEDVKTVASIEFKQVVESLLHDFQTHAPNQVHVRDPSDDMDKIFSEYPMTGRFKACDFDENAIKGAWKALGIASAIPGPRQPQWEEQTDEIVACAPKVLLDLVTRAYSGALSDDQRKSVRMKASALPTHAEVDSAEVTPYPMSQMLRAKLQSTDLAAYPAPDRQKTTFTAFIDTSGRIDIDEILWGMRESPELKQAILGIAKDMTHDSAGKTPRNRNDDEGPGL